MAIRKSPEKAETSVKSETEARYGREEIVRVYENYGILPEMLSAALSESDNEDFSDSEVLALIKAFSGKKIK